MRWIIQKVPEESTKKNNMLVVLFVRLGFTVEDSKTLIWRVPCKSMLEVGRLEIVLSELYKLRIRSIKVIKFGFVMT